MVRLGSGREFDLIRSILSSEADDDSGLVVGPGDDAAVLDRDARVVSTDLVIEDVHFRRSWLEPDEVGYRATMAALSDLAAMGAAPVAVLASLAASVADAESGFLVRVGRGVRRAAREVGAELAGGDVTRSPGPLVLDVVVIGDAEDPLLRSGARPGDGLFVTGTLGAAGGAVESWLRGDVPDAAVRGRFTRPRPRFGPMTLLRASGLVTAAMDVSDGLLGDAGHLAAASGVALRVDAGRIPVDPALEGVTDPESALRLALTGGEDYELLLTGDPGLEDCAERLREIEGIPLTRIGTVEDGAGVTLVGGPDLGSMGGFDHFRPGGTPGGGEP